MPRDAMTPEHLLRRTEPLEDELLSSYLWRLGQLNFFEPPDLIWTLIGVRRPSSNLLSQPEAFGALSQLTGQSVNTLFKLSLHPLAERFSTPDAPLERFDLKPGLERAWVTHRGHRLALRSERKVWWCPECLRQGTGFRRSWMCLLVAACPQHGTLLLGGCPGCQSALSLETVLKGRCGRCRAALWSHRRKLLAPENLAGSGQGDLQAWLLGQIPQLGWPSRASSRALLGMVWGLTECLLGRPELWPETLKFTPAGFSRGLGSQPIPLQQATPRQMLVCVAHALSLLRDWPHGLHSLLEKVRGPSYLVRSPDPTLWNRGGALCRTWLARRWVGPRFEFVGEALDDFIVKTTPFDKLQSLSRSQVRSQMGSRYPALSVSDAALVLGESWHTAGWLEDLGLLKPRGGCAPYVQLLALKAKLERPLSWPRAAQLLGLDWRWLRPYLSATPARDPLQQVYAADPSTVDWSVLRETLQVMHSAKSLPQRPYYMDSHELTLDILLPELEVLGMGTQGFVREVVCGKFRLGHMLHWKAGYGGWTLFRSTWHHYTLEGRRQQGVMDRRDASRHLHVSEDSLEYWLETGQLHFLLGRQVFARAEVEALEQQHLTLQGAARCLGIEFRYLQRWWKAGKLNSLSIPLSSHTTHSHLLSREGVILWWAGNPLERRRLESRKK